MLNFGTGYRYAETKNGTLSFLASNPDLPAMGLDDMLGNRQSQSTPGIGSGFVSFEKSLEDVR